MKKITTLLASTALVSAIFCSSLNAQLVCHLTFDNSSTQDISGNGAHATNNGCTFVTDRFGNPNAALMVDNGSWLQGPSTNFPLGTSSRSISTWVEMDINNLSNAGVLFGYGGSNPYGSGYGMMLAKNCSGGTCGLKIYSFGYGNDYQLPYNAALNSWVHLVATYNGSTVKIYVNGILQGSTTKNWNTILGSGLYSIGNNKAFFPNYPGGDTYKGKIDDMRLYGHVLSQQEISALYNASSQVGINDLASNKINIYPNPATDFIKIAGINNIQSIEIIDITGKIVKKHTASELYDNTLLLNGIEQGLYIMSIRDEEGNNYTQKFNHIKN